ncbi:hypothetical protein AAHA92_31284 [Salvia divinorum]|uniref:Uncharacterized protein n=1 Tax=Salvia divinorum TaxID=28513 RepID=A0ABD1FTP2_SALDI
MSAGSRAAGVRRLVSTVASRRPPSLSRHSSAEVATATAAESRFGSPTLKQIICSLRNIRGSVERGTCGSINRIGYVVVTDS